jgi:hypothetical protein
MSDFLKSCVCWQTCSTCCSLGQKTELDALVCMHVRPHNILHPLTHDIISLTFFPPQRTTQREEQKGGEEPIRNVLLIGVHHRDDIFRVQRKFAKSLCNQGC